MRMYPFVGLMMAVASLASAGAPEAFDAAEAFGQRSAVYNMRLSPDGQRVVYIAPRGARGSLVVTVGLAPNSRPTVTLSADGFPDRVEDCNWVSNERLVCTVYGITRAATILVPFTRLFAVNADGTNPRILSKHDKLHQRGVFLSGGEVIDWLPEQDGAVLMVRQSLPDDRLGTRTGSTDFGAGVDWIDTRTLEAKRVEGPNRIALGYLTDGHGNVRLMATRVVKAQQLAPVTDYLYRRKGTRDWESLGSFNALSGEGFVPIAVDRDLDVAYGFKRNDGRFALYTIALDGTHRESLAFARDDVDVDSLIRVGRHARVVGVSYATDYRGAHYFDPAFERLAGSLGNALPNKPGMRIIDSSFDENRLLVYASRDNDSGAYYVFDRKRKELQAFLVSRPSLEGVKLATERPITYPAKDGTLVPGYLTLPPGVSDPKGIPAIVMPHGGPNARDEWGFNWLAQFYAARGFAVLQPNYRGSAGYGEAWFQKNGFQSWPTAISDVLDGGRWLVSTGLADPDKLAIIGWSYGGYAALQSAAVDPKVFKAVVAIAPVTDLDALKEQHRRDGTFELMTEFIGGGTMAREGSPALVAHKISAPVLLFHGTTDLNVPYEQSVEMVKALGPGKHELVTFDGLDHQLDDTAARVEMLRRSDAFLRQELGIR